MAIQSSKTLGLLLLILVFGVGGRWVRSISPAGTTPGEAQPALEAQLGQVNAARGSVGKQRPSAGRRTTRSRDRNRVRPDSATADRTTLRTFGSAIVRSETTPIGAIDPATIRVAPSSRVTPVRHSSRESEGRVVAELLVNLDAAPASEIERLPRIGPVLAKRIVEDRIARGPFSSLAGFQRVRGVGPAMARVLQGRVTFGGSGRPSHAESPPR